MIITGFGFMVQMAACNSILQTIVDDDKRGRVMSLFIMAVMGAAPFGSLLGGSLSETWGAPAALLTGGLCCLGASYWFFRRASDISKIIHPIYTRLGVLPEIASGLDTAAELSSPANE